MNKLKLLFLEIVLFPYSFSIAQDKTESKFGIKFGGYVSTDVFMDTRINNSAPREGYFFLIPSNKSLDNAGNDVNKKNNFNILSIQTRLNGKISGPDVLNAKTSAFIESEFFGHTDADINGLRLRHAYAKFNWSKTELMIGQYWHPMFVADVSPSTLSFNTGAPIQPFSRNPQLRVTQKIFNGLSVIGVLSSERDFSSYGPTSNIDPKAITSSLYLRNSGLPMAHLQFQYRPDSTEHVFGAGVDYKSIVPYTNISVKKKIYKSDATVNSISALAFMKLKFKPVIIKLEAVYAQNAYDLTMLGGYAVKKIDSVNGNISYTNSLTAAYWVDVQSNTKKIQVGVFAGHSRNYGYKNNAIPNLPVYTRGGDIKYLYRFAPRITYITGSINISAEVEYTLASYGTTDLTNGKVIYNSDVANTRYIIGLLYNF
ncbi:MAG: hypothetical protein Q8880_04035 [Bacteroidota bacterium]|nr:hypothetical protein [Bacteroidota bacterium]